MRIAYITGDIVPTGNFSLFHDLLANYPKDPGWNHRVYLIAPRWERGLVQELKNRRIDVRACFEEFQTSTDAYWDKIKQDTRDCDVIISGNIANLDDILPDDLKVPVVSLSIAEKGYRSQTGSYGTFYKPRFYKAAVSQTAVNAFPKHVRDEVEVVYSGIDSSRLVPRMTREALRNQWFPGRSTDVKLALFIGLAQESKGFLKAVEALKHLPKCWNLFALGQPGEVNNIPPEVMSRVHFCTPTYHVGDIFEAVDTFVLPTEHEGLSMALLEAWSLMVPTVTTRHNTLLELEARHPDTDFGSTVAIEHTGEELATAIQEARPSESASETVSEHYMVQNMVQRWQTYLEKIVGQHAR